MSAVIYPPNIKDDRDKLFACYSLIEQMRLEHNRQAVIAKGDWKAYAEKFRTYIYETEARLEQVLTEQNRLKEKILWANYTPKQWKAVSKLSEDERIAISISLFGNREQEKVKITKATSPLLDELKAINLDDLPGKPGVDPTEDFTTYTEADPNTHISKTADRITWAGLTRNEDAWVYKDKGENHFDGDFEFLFKCLLTSSDNIGCSRLAVLTNTVDDTNGIYLASGDYLGTSFVRGGDAVYRFFLIELDGGTYYTDWGYISLSTTYYIKFKRNEAVGTYGTIYAYIYTGGYGETLVDTLTLTLHTSKKDFRYIFGLDTDNDDTSYIQSGWIELLDLQEGAVVEGSTAFSGAGTLSATAKVTHTASATLSGQGSMAARGSYLRLATAALSGAGALAVTAKVTRLASATLSGTGTLTAAGTVIGAAICGSATLSGTGTLVAAARCIRLAAAPLAGEGSLSAHAKCTLTATATLSGQGSLSASVTIVLFATAQFSGTGTLSAYGVRIVTASTTLSGVGSLTAAGQTFGLKASLFAAQKKPHRLPYVEAKVHDYEQGIKRLSWARLYEGSEPDNHHGIAFDGQGSMHRIRAAASNTLYRQKITSPGPSSDYSQWTQIASDCAGPCAIAASGAKIYVFYRTTTNVLWKYYSHDYGQSWDNAQLVAYADVLSLAACWWATGDIVVCFALKANQLNGIVLDTSDQTTSQHTYSDSNHPLLDTYGIGATYNPFWPAIEVVFAGKESDSPYNHYDLFRTKFSNTYNFLPLESFLMSPEGEDITCEYPDCHLPTSAQSYETNRIVAVEKFAGTTAYTRPITCHMVKGTYWSDTTFTEPKPFLDVSPSYGLRIASTSDYWWMEKPNGVWRAPRPADSPLDLTGDIMTLLLQNVIASPTSVGRGNLVLELDNSKGQYASPGSGALASLRFRSEIVLKLGYKTPEGNLALEAGTYWIDSWEYQSVSLRGESRSNLSTFTLTCLDGWGLMDHWTARYQMRWNKDAVNPKSVWQILYQLLARVGIKLTNTPAKPQSSAINNFYPDFTVSPGTQGDSAIKRLLSFVPDRLVFRGQEAFTKNPLASEASCYSYGTDHVILAGEYSEQVFTSRARAIGRDTEDNRILEEALDWDLLALAIDQLEQDYDPNLQTAARTQERADALLREVSLRAQRGNLVIPTNVGQELLDVVEVTDERCGISEENYRVQAIHTDYDRRQGIYTQRLALCAP